MDRTTSPAAVRRTISSSGPATESQRRLLLDFGYGNDRRSPGSFGCCGVGLQIFGNGRRVCLVIGEVDKVRNLELLPVPARYSDRVLTKLNWVEFLALRSVPHRSGANPEEGEPRAGQSYGTLVSQILLYVAHNFSARTWRTGSRRQLVGGKPLNL